MIKKLAVICILFSFSGCVLYQDHNLNIYNPERITKKSFGTYVTPLDSPVDPEVFTGYHTAIDFETFEHEADVEVPVYAICEGPLVVNRWAQGYGGVVIQSCKVNGDEVTVIYGHLDLESVPDQDIFSFGDVVGFLGNAYSNETDNERKHLHLGIHKGNDINLFGYVQEPSDLNDWIDPWEIVSLTI
ncbi:M23 family metallopeptidase [Patescibacteria group bacterium]